MTPHPSDPSARTRLREAQRQEADALKAVELATRTRDRAQRKLDATNVEVGAAKYALISVSGMARAALLLGEDQPKLRRCVRAAHAGSPTGAGAADAPG